MITVHIQPGHCPACTATRRALDARGVTYTTTELTADSVETFKAAGITSAPVVEANGETWGGFRPDKIINLK